LIAVEARGRLGNQMFQFAFGLAASRRLGTDFVMAEDVLRTWFELDGRSRLMPRIARAVRYRVSRRVAPFAPVTIPSDGEIEPEDVLRGLVDRADYNGFFQSERYFSDVRDGVRAAFAPCSRHRRDFRSRYATLLGRPYICCHIRRGDYVSYRGGVALPVSYYRDALMELGREPDVPVVFVGDDLSVVSRDMPGPNIMFERNSEIVDLLLLSHASAVVASNSSFAWWGAWMNTVDDVRVVAPRYWLGLHEQTEWPRHVIPERWIQLPVTIGD